MWRRPIKHVAQWTPRLLSPTAALYRVGINLLLLSRADEEIPTTDVKLELELESQEALIKSPNLALHCALRSPVQPHLAQPAPAYTKVIRLHHPASMKKWRIAAAGGRDQVDKKEGGSRKREGAEWVHWWLRGTLAWIAWRKVHRIVMSPQCQSSCKRDRSFQQGSLHPVSCSRPLKTGLNTSFMVTDALRSALAPLVSGCQAFKNKAINS